MTDQSRPVLVAAVGNTRVRLGLWVGGEVVDAVAVPFAEAPGALKPLLERASESGLCAVASVNRDAEKVVIAAIEAADAPVEVLRVGIDLPIPLTHTLEDASTLGRDRALNALAAYARAEQACAIVDVGTAVTLDFVDGEGTFHGGLIAPGVRMMLSSLHEHTDALPKLDSTEHDPDRGAFGKDTRHAMQLGVRTAVAGLVRTGVERFADSYDAWPQVIATGGDAAMLEDEGIIEHFVPDLQLLGIGLCIDRAASDARGDADDSAEDASAE